MSTNQFGFSKQPVKIKDLGKLVREKRKANKLTLEEVAERIGVSAATLSRLERQQVKALNISPDTRTITAIASWLGVSIDGFSGIEEKLAQRSTPDLIEAHLRADRKLDPEAAEKLGIMFRLAYEQFTKSNSGVNSNPNDESD
jgi:transcriptional regulator with XRE-family HTH domain